MSIYNCNSEMGEFDPELNVQDDFEYQEDNIDFSEMIYIDEENLQNSDVILINSIIDGIYKNYYITDDKSIVDFNKNHKICNFAILTKNIEKFNRSFPNNVIDINGRSKEKLLRCIKWVLNKGRKNMEELDNIFLTSDQHFFHGNIIKYCNRPWNSGKDSDGNIIVTQKDIEEMNEEMIMRWNSVVPNDGIVYHLGDFALGDRNKIKEILPRLNGKINLIMGNHDTKSVDFYYECGFNRVYDHPILLKDFFILSHEPISFLNKNSCFGNIYGHVHDSDVYKTFSPNSCCVCVERHDYKPISLKYIIEKCKEVDKV